MYDALMFGYEVLLDDPWTLRLDIMTITSVHQNKLNMNSKLVQEIAR